MEDQDRRLIAEAAVEAEKKLDKQQGSLRFETIRPDRFPYSSYQGCADWRKHFAGVVDSNS